jgi:hypothetical protein
MNDFIYTVTDPKRLLTANNIRPITIDRPNFRNYRLTDEQLSTLLNSDFATETIKKRETMYTLQPSYFTSTQMTKKLNTRHL